MKKNTKGSTLITVVVALLLVVIVIGTTLTIVFNMHGRTVNEYCKREAYLISKSVVDAIAGEIATDPTSEMVATLGADKEYPKITIEGVGGQSSAKVVYSEATAGTNATKVEVLTITATSTYDTQTYTISLTMNKSGDNWYKRVYSNEGEVFTYE